MSRTVQIDSRFNGPPCSGNGGYTCGLIGQQLEGPSVVRLRIPPPLETPMDLRQETDGLALYDGDILVATSKAATIDIDVPQAPDFVAAQKATQAYRGFESHFYPSCFVCGPKRQKGDGLRIFAGPLEAGSGPEGMVAAAWIPDESLCDSSGFVATEIIWAALDCPGAYSFPEPEDKAILLGELAVSITGKVRPAENCVLIGWEIRQEGRKHYTGTALFGEAGGCRAIARAIWIEVPWAVAKSP